MSPRDSRSSRGRERRKPSRRGTVVGSTVRDVSNRLEGRGLPRGGLRERDGLKVGEGARPDTTLNGQGRTDKGSAGRVLRVVVIASASIAALLVAITLVIMLLSHTGAFAITTVKTYDSEHITAEQVARLANVPEGSTLLNLDFSAVEEGVKKNPWVASVEIERVFPNTVHLKVHERSIGALVAMGTGGTAWYLGNDGVWIEPAHFDTDTTTSFNDIALAEAESLGVVLISDVPASVSPVAGSAATDKSLAAVKEFQEQLSPEFQERIVNYSAASEDDISCVLSNGVEIAFGSTASIDAKESVAARILEEYEGQVTYINVRVPSHPTYRRVNSDFVREGTGPTGTMTEETEAEKKHGDQSSDEDDDAAMTTETGGTATSVADGSSYAADGSETTSSADGSGYGIDGYDTDGTETSSYDDESGYDTSGTANV